MNRKLILLATTSMLIGSAAAAEVSIQSIIDGFTEQGFTSIEIERGPNQIKVEASDGTREVEVVYDRETGDVLKQEQGTDDDGDDGDGVSVRDSNEDFLDDDDDDDHDFSADDDDDDDDDSADDEHDDDDDDDDDDSGSDDDDDDDSDDSDDD